MNQIVEKLPRCFYERYGIVKEKFQERVQHIKIAFHRCFYSGNLKTFTCTSADYQITKNIKAIAETIDRVLRSKSDVKETESPMERLETLMNNSPNFIIDNYITHLDLIDFCVEPHVQASFQHHFQWICDLTLYMLSLIPHYDDRKKDKVSDQLLTLYTFLFTNSVLFTLHFHRIVH